MIFCCRKKAHAQESSLLFINDMVVDMPIGVNADEKGKNQRVRVNITAEPEIWPGPACDDISKTVSYDMLVRIVQRHTSGNAHIELVETLAERIASDSLKENAIRKITVRIEKLDIYPFAIPGAEITRIKR